MFSEAEDQRGNEENVLLSTREKERDGGVGRAEKNTQPRVIIHLMDGGKSGKGSDRHLLGKTRGGSRTTPKKKTKGKLDYYIKRLLEVFKRKKLHKSRPNLSGHEEGKVVEGGELNNSN